MLIIKGSKLSPNISMSYIIFPSSFLLLIPTDEQDTIKKTVKMNNERRKNKSNMSVFITKR